MTDPGDEEIAVDAPPECRKIQNKPTVQPDVIAIELQRSQSSRDLKTFRTLINIKVRLEDPESTAAWNRVIVELLRIISASDDVGEEQVLLASLAFVNVLFRTRQLEDFTNQLRTYWSLEDQFLKAFGEDFQIHDLEWFKLVVTHGYLQVNIDPIYVREIISLPFDVLRRNCLTYTKYSYFAYKTLQSWLEKTSKTDFWWANDALTIEKDLEAIIFSNWDSSICEIAQRNSTKIFAMYLRIMSDKYDGFLNNVFEECIQNLSWQNELKYIILTEVCKIWDDLPKIVSSNLPSCLFTSLTKNHLKHPGTKLYLTILDKLKANEWEEIFSESFFRTSVIWESSQQETAIELLWEQWMKPTIVKLANVFELLWKHDSMKQLKLSRSYLEKIGDRHGFQLIYEDSKIDDILNKRVIDISEPVRLNAFAVLCQLKNWTIAVNEVDPFCAVKKFLYFNVDTSSISMRKGIVKYFDILFANIVKLADKDPDAEPHIRNFLQWLHEFLLDCFELGASYQRKILAMRLYEIVLILTSFDDCKMGIWNKNKTMGERRKLITCATKLRKNMNGTEKWLYCDLKSARIMFSLIFDPVAEVSDKASFMITQYFCTDVFPPEEGFYCWSKNEKYCKSSKIYEVAIGATLEKLKHLWDPKFTPPLYNDRPSTVLHHVSCARNQLSKMEYLGDILRCLQDESPVYGSLTVILEVGFLMAPVEKIYNESTVRKILELAEDVNKFFLSALSAKSKSAKYSSSFEEMGHAIGDSIRNSEIDGDPEECILTTAHQLLLSGIWMSLKVSSEIAAEIGLIAETEEFARRAIDLIVSVLLRCRHKGAIEAAGLALAKLTKSLSKGKYNGLIESHLVDLLKIDNNDNINLTRRGAGLTIMFYRIVSSDDRRNRPWLHLAVRKLLDSLKMKTEDESIQSEDCLVDSPRARHLHFLRSLVADKALQAQLVPYFEDICLTCFIYLQSSEWTVRNASLQLFGAIVPRLVGQCSARELDYGVGNSVEHFVTHYPTLAKTLMSQLDVLVKSFCHGEGKNCSDIHINSNVVPILTLLSKMSTGGCELVDYSSKNYLSEAREAFSTLLEHPVFNVRVLASKAYAAFVPLPEIPYELAELQLKSLSAQRTNKCNQKHGQYCAQLYLGRKLKHELQCTSDTFFIRKHKDCENVMRLGTHLQLQLLRQNINRFLKCEEQICYTVQSALIKCLIESAVSFTSQDFPLDWTQVHVAISNMLEERSKPGFSEFLDNLMSLSVQLKVAHDTSLFSDLFHKKPHCHEHRVAIMKHLRAESDNLQFFVEEALAIFDDHTKSDILLSLVSSIMSTSDAEKPSKDLAAKIRILKNKLQVDYGKSRVYDQQMRYFGYCLGPKFYGGQGMQETMPYILEDIYDEDTTVKELSLDYLLRSIAVCENFLRDTGELLERCNIFFEAIILMLKDEDPEIRELMARALQPVLKIFDKTSDEPVCAKASLHMILHRLSLLRAEDYQSKYLSNSSREFLLDRQREFLWNAVLSIFAKLALQVKCYVSPEQLHSPFQPDDTLNRDETSLVNVLFYFVETFIKHESPTGNESVEIQEIDGIINAKYAIQRSTNLDLTHLKVLLNLDRLAYVSMKKDALSRMIEKYRSELWVQNESLMRSNAHKLLSYDYDMELEI